MKKILEKLKNEKYERGSFLNGCFTGILLRRETIYCD